VLGKEQLVHLIQISLVRMFRCTSANPNFFVRQLVKMQQMLIIQILFGQVVFSNYASYSNFITLIVQQMLLVQIFGLASW
jgi:hypothetical protein